MASAQVQVRPAQPWGFAETLKCPLCSWRELCVEQGLVQLRKAGFIGKVLFTLDKEFF